ncbi:hypothetical protein [Thiomicrospira microaerophila]|uniref:hypothetical protein n=1 Tax=Thiomicrospira microaerophila TaxID=406020 RepID=UPI0005C82964|nr:hypothetical protein [Thiomicrospira microaerophila]
MKKIIELKLDPVSRRIIKSYLLILLLVGLMLLARPFWLHLEERSKQSLGFQQLSVSDSGLWRNDEGAGAVIA